MGQPHLSPGAVFAGDFRIIKPLREGGMGAVYVVEQVSTGRQRALKLMAAELVDNPEVRERFIREAKVAANIESDHVVETVTAGVDTETGAPFLVMELLRGEELGDAMLRTGALPVIDVLEIFEQVGHALEQAHAQGIVHRDLKPENIFLAASKRRDVPYTAKVLDFGIAKLVADGMQKTGTQPLGSPYYMAPEQTDRKGRICPATDVWALGLIAFYLLTGRHYWREGGENGSLPGLLREICVDPVVPASERAKALEIPEELLPPGFDAWFARCVDRDIDARFPEAGAAVRAFAEVAKPMPVVPRKLVVRVDPASTVTLSEIEAAKTAMIDEGDSARTGRGPAGGTTGAAAVSARSVTTAQPAPPAKSKTPLLLAGVAAAALLGGGGYLLVGSGTVGQAPTLGSGAAPASSESSAPASSASAAAPVGKCPPGMVFHPAGSTFTGAPSLPEASGARIVGHKVKLSAFCLDQHEVSVRRYEACVAASSCEKTPDDVNYSDNLTDEQKKRFVPFCNARKPDRLDHPINCINFSMAQQFCAFAKGRLPTEAEWEYAAKGTSQRDFPWGDDPPSPKYLNAGGDEFVEALRASGATNAPAPMYGERDPFVGTAPVGSFPAGRSAYGVDDLAGNVWEWTSDFYAPYEKGEFENPTGPKDGTDRVVRGGAFNSTDKDWTRPGWRWHALPDRYSHAIGFRCAATPNGG